MNATEAHYREVLQRALDFMRAQPGAATTVASLAAHVGYSPGQLWCIFKALTGKGVLHHLRAVRLETARQLLRQTSLTIGEIAFKAGFESQSAFGLVFRQATGTTPTLYRLALREGGRPGQSEGSGGGLKARRVELRDDFATSRLAEWWEPLAGNWTVHDGRARGERVSQAMPRLATRLPENFRVEITFQSVRGATYPGEGLRLSLANGSTPERVYCLVDLKGAGREAATLGIRFRTVLWNPKAFVEAGRWHTVRMELVDNRISVHLDGKPVFAYRDLFPPPYASRNRLILGSPAKFLVVRRFRLLDLGFLPVTPEIRQGDALFNSGLFEPAREFYERHLVAGLPADDEMELRFKIGLCLYRGGHLAAARDWMRDTRRQVTDPRWRRECDLVLLQLSQSLTDTADFERQLRKLRHDPTMSPGLRPLVSDYFYALAHAGFIEQAIRVARAWRAMERGHSKLATRPLERLAGLLKNTRRFSESEHVIRALERLDPSEEVRREAVVARFDMALMQGLIGDARRILAEAETRGHTPGPWWGDTQRALCLRAEGQFEQAAELLLAAAGRKSDTAHQDLGMLLTAAELLCRLGQFARAQALVGRVLRNHREPSPSSTDAYRHFLFGSRLPRGRFAEVAKYLLEESRREGVTTVASGQAWVSAGILLEIAGNPDAARETWGAASRHMSPDRCYFWGSLAKALASGKPDRLETMNLFWSVRSEIFCLAGLLYEHRGNAKRADALFALSVKEDPTSRWPAHMAVSRLRAANR